MEAPTPSALQNSIFDPNSYEAAEILIRELEAVVKNISKPVLENREVDPPAISLSSKITVESEETEEFFPKEIQAKIVKAGLGDNMHENAKWLGSVARISPLFNGEAHRNRVKLINREKLPIGILFGLETKDEVLKFLRRNGERLTYLNLDAIQETMIFKLFILEDLIEVLKSCPKLKELSLTGFSGDINDELWNTLFKLGDLTDLNITNCSELKNIPILNLPKLERFKFHGTILSLPATLPELLLELELSNLKRPNEPGLLFQSTLPDRLRVLKLNGFSAPQMPPLPNTLIEINLENFTCPAFPNQWPPHLQKLIISHATFQGVVPQIPPSLLIFELFSCDAITQLPNFSDTLKELLVQYCINIVEIRTLPPNVEKFYFMNTELISIPAISPKVRDLGLSTSDNIWDILLRNLPTSVKRFVMRASLMDEFSCVIPPHLEMFSLDAPPLQRFSSELPQGLKEFHLFVTGGFDVSELPLPASLEKLTLLGISFEQLPELPQTLVSLKIDSVIKNLKLSHMSKLVSVECENPKFEYVNITDCPKLNSLSLLASGKSDKLKGVILRNLPQLRSYVSLESSWMTLLDLQDCHNISIISDLNNSITTVNLSGCKKLRSMGTLPLLMQSINVTGCDKLKVLDLKFKVNLTVIEGEFPIRMEKLDLYGCSSLKSAPRILPKTLKVLDLTNCPYHDIWSNEYLQELKSQNPQLKISGMREKPSEFKVLKDK